MRRMDISSGRQTHGSTTGFAPGSTLSGVAPAPPLLPEEELVAERGAVGWAASSPVPPPPPPRCLSAPPPPPPPPPRRPPPQRLLRLRGAAGDDNGSCCGAPATPARSPSVVPAPSTPSTPIASASLDIWRSSARSWTRLARAVRCSNRSLVTSCAATAPLRPPPPPPQGCAPCPGDRGSSDDDNDDDDGDDGLITSCRL
jgi:hypothetical protein